MDFIKEVDRIDKQFANVSSEFKRLVAIDMILSFMMQRPVIAIIRTDENFSKADPEYDHQTHTYRGKNVAMAEYVLEKYGEDALKFVESLIRGLDETNRIYAEMNTEIKRVLGED